MLDYERAKPKSSRPFGNSRWFAIGFLFTFVALLVFLPTIYANGLSIRHMPLWSNYVQELRFQFRSQRNLGAKPDGFGPLFSMLGQHMVLSSLGGLAVWGVVVIVRKARRGGI